MNYPVSPVAHSEWATPIAPVVIKDGTVRICGDYKVTLNRVSAVVQYPFPVIENMFACLNGGDRFSTMDLRDAYNQVPLADESRKLAFINTHRELFRYNRLSFGIASAPAIFQRKIESVLQGLPNVQAYLDHVILSEQSTDDGTKSECLLQRFREHGVKLHKDKCRFRQDLVVYLGHQIDGDGQHPIEKNLESSIAAVSTFREGLLGLGFAQDEAFNNARKALTIGNVLTHFDPTKELRLECDASQYGVGAVLFHRVGKEVRPIGFRSCMLTAAEKNYSQLERKALDLIFGVTKSA